MTDKEYAPLTSLCVRSLNDKLYEKRKVGALEIEKMVREFSLQNNEQQIKKILRFLGKDFAGSTNANSKNGGLIGLAAAAIALGKDSSMYVNELVLPVLACFKDADSRVRYYSCEALYNIVKVARGAVLPFFNEIFDALSKLAADTDQNVKNGTELLDRLIKDIVTESSSFDLVAFIPLLRERIYTVNQFARQFLVSWIQTLDSVPDINMLVLLPEILDGLFEILGDQSQEIRKMCQNVLQEFLVGIKKKPDHVNFAGMANILITHSQNENDLISYTSIVWLREFVTLAGRSMLPFVSGILAAVLPRLVSADIDTKSKKSVREAAESLNEVLMNLIDEVDDNPTPAGGTPSRETTPALANTTRDSTPRTGSTTRDVTLNAKGEVTGDGSENNLESDLSLRQETQYRLTTDDLPAGSVLLDVESVIKILCGTVETCDFQTRIASLKWFSHLLIKVPNKTFRFMSQVFPVLLKTLGDKNQSDEAALLTLQVLAEISSNPAGISAIDSNSKDSSEQGGANVGVSSSVKEVGNTDRVESPGSTNRYFIDFMLQLLEMFKKDRFILEKRGAFIIRQLCLLLSPEDIFRSLSEILQREVDLKFACTMVQTLSTILLTSTELFELRNDLKDLHSKESCQLFCCLYKSWSHSPVATLAICYLSQNYGHACRLLPVFGNLEITVDFLNEIDKLIQLIESPIFAYLRLQLLDTSTNQDLIKSLYGLLMLLPQAEPFTLLRNRLSCVPNFQIVSPPDKARGDKAVETRTCVCEIDFEDLLQHFIKVQAHHREARRRHTGFLKPLT